MIELNFSLKRGEFDLCVAQTLTGPLTALLGPSGCGKSTLLATIAGLIRPQHGSICVEGRVLCDTATQHWVPPHRRRIGMVFQHGHLFPHLTVRQNLLYGYRNLPAEDRRISLDAVVERFEIGHLLRRFPWQLSGGEQQRIAMGRAILYAPTLLLLDEPLASLDLRLKQQILPFLLRIRDEFKIPMIYVTHYHYEVEQLGCPVLNMEHGRLTPSSATATRANAAQNLRHAVG
jgi:molybdate transport system ATP-binding protein